MCVYMCVYSLWSMSFKIKKCPLACLLLGFVWYQYTTPVLVSMFAHCFISESLFKIVLFCESNWKSFSFDWWAKSVYTYWLIPFILTHFCCSYHVYYVTVVVFLCMMFYFENVFWYLERFVLWLKWLPLYLYF